MPLNDCKLPELKSCCGCITDLKIACAIIAVLGIVTSPALSWAVVRHSYVIRVSCIVSTSGSRADVVDVNFKNILSFGFGGQFGAGLGPSCLGSTLTKSNQKTTNNKTTDPADPAAPADPVFRTGLEKPVTSDFVSVLKYIGWIVLAADVVFLASSIYFLYKIFNVPFQDAALIFMWSCIVSIIVSFIYGLIYISVCTSVSGSFPIFEFAFTIFDVLLWIYFLIVVNSYR